MGRPKAFLPFRSSTFLETILSTIREAAVDRAVVAIAPDDPNILKIRALPEIAIAVNAVDRSVGPISSIATGINGLINYPVEGILVWPVDIPHVASATIRLLCGTFNQTGKSVVIPTFQGRRGHPVIFSKAVFPELLSVPGGRGADWVVHRDPGRVTEVPVNDQAILEDIDTPEDYARLISSTKSLL